MVVIRKKDKYNFILAEKLKEPLTYEVAGVSITTHFKNLPFYYGRLEAAVIGLYKHTKRKNPPVVPHGIKPSSSEELYEEYMEVSL